MFKNKVKWLTWAPLPYKSWDQRKMTIQLTEWGFTQEMKLGWPRKIQGMSQSMFSGLTRLKALKSVPLFRSPWWPLTWMTRTSYFILGIWISFCVNFHLFLSFLFCTFLLALGFTPRTVFQDYLCIHASKWPAYVAHNHYPGMNLSQMDGDCFSVTPPIFKHLSPCWLRCYSI